MRPPLSCSVLLICLWKYNQAVNTFCFGTDIFFHFFRLQWIEMGSILNSDFIGTLRNQWKWHILSFILFEFWRASQKGCTWGHQGITGTGDFLGSGSTRGSPHQGRIWQPGPIWPPARSWDAGRHWGSLSPRHWALPWGKWWPKAGTVHGWADHQDQAWWWWPGGDTALGWTLLTGSWLLTWPSYAVLSIHDC